MFFFYLFYFDNFFSCCSRVSKIMCKKRSLVYTYIQRCISFVLMYARVVGAWKCVCVCVSVYSKYLKGIMSRVVV